MIADRTELERVRQEAKAIVTSRALAAAAAAVVPLPGLDLVADIGILATILPAISARFGLDHDSVAKLEPHRAQRVFAVAANLGNTTIGRLITRRLAARLLRRAGLRLAAGQLARYVPLIGSAISASIGFGAIKLAGDAHVEDCYRASLALLEG